MPTLSRTLEAPQSIAVALPGVPVHPVRRPSVVSVQPSLLIVEESGEMQEHLMRFLRPHYRVSVFSTARDALAAAQECVFDLVLIDIEHNRETEAVTMLKQFRKIEACADIPVVALTGYTLPAGKAVLKRGVFSAYLAKPFTLGKLKETIRRCIVKRTVTILNRI